MSDNSDLPTEASHAAKAVQNCELCHDKPAKYRCPGCLLRTCSLDCSKAHKSQNGCSGERDRTRFVKRGEYNENTLISDYNFLQDLKRDHTNTLCAGNENVARVDSKISNTLNRKAQSGPANISSIVLNRAQKTVISHAKSKRQVIIRYMSPGIQRHQQNKTLWAASKSRLVWTLELSVPELESKPNRWVETGFHDVCKLGELWTRLLDYTCGEPAGLRQDEENGERRAKKRHKSSVVRIQLPSDDGTEYPFKSSVCMDTLHAIKNKFENTPIAHTTWLIRLQDKPANKPTFCVLDPMQPLYTQLRYHTVNEFPTIYVFSKVPTAWDGYEITIQQHIIESTSENPLADTCDRGNEAEHSIAVCGIDSEPLPENSDALEDDSKAEAVNDM